jgi:hypothetical protein
MTIKREDHSLHFPFAFFPSSLLPCLCFRVEAVEVEMRRMKDKLISVSCGEPHLLLALAFPDFLAPTSGSILQYICQRLLTFLTSLSSCSVLPLPASWDQDFSR